MAIVFNDSHPLAANVLACFGVNPTTDLVIDFKTPTRELTPDASVVIGTGTYGKHFKTITGSNKGISLTALGDTTAAYPSSTRFVVLNSITGSTGRASFHNQGYTNPTILLSSTGKAGSGFGATTQATAPAAQGTTTILNTGAHSVALSTTGTTSHDIYVDGAHEATGGRLVYSSSASLTHIGGYTTYGSVAAEFAWYVVFDKTLSPTEIADLHSSLGADGAFGLVYENGLSSDVTPPVLTLLGGNPLTINEGGVWSDPGFTCVDDTDGDLSGSVSTNTYWYSGVVGEYGISIADVDTNFPGTYTKVYSVVDAAGNPSEQIRTINVVDLAGVRGADTSTTGQNGGSVLADKPTLPADNDTIFYAELVTAPTVGTFRLFADGSFVYDAPIGTTDTFTYQWYKGGVLQGSEMVSLLVGGSTVEAHALYSNINSMLSGKIGTLNTSVDISVGYTDVDAGDVNYNVFSNFNTVTNYSSPSGSIVEVSTIFSTSSDMGNAPVSDVISLVDFNTILNSTSLANIIANATLVNNIQSGFVVDRDCILNDSILFNVSSNYISTTGDTGVSAIAAITSAYSMLASNYAQTGAGISSVLSSIAQSVGISNQFAGIVDANNVSVLASGGQANSSNCSFSLSSSDASISSISIEAIADYSTSLNLLCAVVSNMEASADYMSVASLISSNLSILNAQSSFGISSDLSVTRTMTTSAGATISVTCGYTTSGIQFTSTEVLTPDSRMIRVLSEGRIIQVLA